MTTSLRLDTELSVYRLGQNTYPLFNGGGTFQYRSRWLSPGRRVIHASEHYALAMLEVLVRTRLIAPRNYDSIDIQLPLGTSAERIDVQDLPRGWDSFVDRVASRRVGDEWYDTNRTLVLFVPSVVCRREWNCLINESHAEFGRVSASRQEAVSWDPRLFGDTA